MCVSRYTLGETLDPDHTLDETLDHRYDHPETPIPNPKSNALARVILGDSSS